MATLGRRVLLLDWFPAARGKAVFAGKLDKTKNAVIVAGGQLYFRNIFGITLKRKLTGEFYRAPKKPTRDTAATHIIKGGFFGGYKVTVVPAGTWVMHGWFSVQSSPYGYNTISSDIVKPAGLARVKVNPGDVVYIGEYTVREGVVSIQKNMERARSALESEYPRLAKKLVYRPLTITP